jgi:hypothetical protein
MQEMKNTLNPKNAPDFEGVATKGIAVFETLKAIAKIVLVEMKKSAAVR